MKKFTLKLLSVLVGLWLTGCENGSKKESDTRQEVAGKFDSRMQDQKTPLSQEFKSYWYNGEAEISSFKLMQERYGEIREGRAVLIYVTEDFLPDIQVKAENYDPDNIPVLKLNSTKKFITGMYPYSIMQSSFYPVQQQSHALKVSASIQEWCGQVYAQLNNRENFEVLSHSYFEGEADQSFILEKTHLENELWNLIRINPNRLPTGELQVIPSLEFCRLRHKPIKAYEATATINEGSYTLTYPGLNRKLVVRFDTDFPHVIQSWEETNTIGAGSNVQYLTTRAERIHSIRSPYWTKNSNSDGDLRNQLQLD